MWYWTKQIFWGSVVVCNIFILLLLILLYFNNYSVLLWIVDTISRGLPK